MEAQQIQIGKGQGRSSAVPGKGQRSERESELESVVEAMKKLVCMYVCMYVCAYTSIYAFSIVTRTYIISVIRIHNTTHIIYSFICTYIRTSTASSPP